MKVREDIRKLSCTQSNLARALGLTQPRINQLIDEGVVTRDPTDPMGGVMIVESLKQFYKSKSTEAAEDNSVDFWEEKAKHEKAKREITEIKLAETKSEYYLASDVESAWIELLTILRTNLLCLPAKTARLLEGKNSAEIISILTAEVESMLENLINN